MNIVESIRIALAGLFANRLRALLTMLGIIIGVGAVIALVSFGQGVERYVRNQLLSLGSNLLFVIPQAPQNNAKKAIPLTYSDYEAVANPLYVPNALSVEAEYAVFSTVVFGRSDMVTTVSGVTPSFQDVRDWYPITGRFIDETDIVSSARVAVLGKTVITKLFEDSVDPLGQEIRIQNVPFRIIGIMETRGGGGGGFGDADEVVLIPISTAQTRLGMDARTANGDYRISTITVKALSEARMDNAKTEIEQLLTDRHKVEFAGDQNFAVITQTQILSVVGNIMGLLTVFLSMIAGISLVVGGIGIMNIMLVTVTERTREIGLRKAVGARSFDVLIQFLVESIVLSLVGGTLGVIVGSIGAFVGSILVPDLQLTVTMNSVLLATGVSTAIGVFFGLYPASRAANLSPINALRYE